MKLGYICTNFNNAGYTSKAVDSLLANQGHEIAIVVVDNRSKPEDVQQLRDIAARHTAVRLVLLDQNVGYFAGLNAGIRYLRTNFPEVKHMLVGNNDLVFGPQFVDSIVQKLPLLEQYPVVAPDIVTLDGMHLNPHVIAGTSWRRELLYDLYFAHYTLAAVMTKVARYTQRITARADLEQWRTPAVVCEGNGSCYILGPLFFAHFSELWAPTFLYGEEFFLGRQVSERGMAVYYEPTISIQHYCNASIGQLPRKAAWEHARKAHRVYRQYVRIFGAPRGGRANRNPDRTKEFDRQLGSPKCL